MSRIQSSSLGQLDVKQEAAEVVFLVLHHHFYGVLAARKLLVHIQLPLVGLGGVLLDRTGGRFAAISLHSDQGQVNATIGPVGLTMKGFDSEFRGHIEGNRN